VTKPLLLDTGPLGMIEGVYRRPVCPMKSENRAKLEMVLAAQELLQAQKVWHV